MTIKDFIIEEMKLLINNEDYYGSKEQIESEKFILSQTKIKMNYKECLEEYYFRILKTL